MNYSDIMKRTQDGMISTDEANQELLILDSQMQEKADKELMIIKEEISNINSMEKLAYYASNIIAENVSIELSSCIKMQIISIMKTK